MIEQSDGVVLRIIQYSESSLIVHWLTEEQGRIATMARGAKRAKSSFRGKLDLFHRCQLAYRRNTRSTLHTLQEVSLKQTFGSLRHDLEKLTQASYVAQLITRNIEEDTPADGIFSLFLHFMQHLEKFPAAALSSVLHFEFCMLRHLGLEPQWRHDRLSMEAKDLLRAWSQQDSSYIEQQQENAHSVSLELFTYLGRFMSYHLGLPPKLRVNLMKPPLQDLQDGFSVN
ncbi:DNA repair protein RecO [Verrucomicrobia bacterium]|nr:DNA repair protein RecO [Verrucomicrobiota bacterium]MDG1892012.1 DNA repair protein RecO [Verrucomicrobiota bacterium]